MVAGEDGCACRWIERLDCNWDLLKVQTFQLRGTALGGGEPAVRMSAKGLAAS